MSANTLASPGAIRTSGTASLALLRWFPSLRDAAFLLPVIFLFSRLEGLGTLLGDGDTGWHLRTGEWILAHRAVPSVDIFSFTMAGQPWFAWEWLWDLLFGWLHLQFGMGAVVIVNLAVLCFTMYLLYLECWRASGNFILAFAMVFVAAAGSSIHWLARPHLFTMLFTVVTLGILRRAQEGRLKLLWWLPLLSILWVNLHGGFFVAWTFLGAFAVGEALRAYCQRENAWRTARPYLAALVGCVAASFVNPYGWRLHAHVVQYFSDEYHREQILEFQSMSFHHPVALFVGAFVFLGAMAGLWHLQRQRFAEVILFFGWGWLALYSARNIPIFLFALAPALTMAVGEMIKALRVGSLPFSAMLSRLDSWREENEVMERAPRTVWVGPALLIGLALLVSAPAPAESLRAAYSAKRYPEGALPALRDLGPELRLFADDEWGDFLAYRLYPGFRVFIDGRSDFYGERIGADMAHAINSRYDWAEILKRHRINAVLLHANAPLAGTLKESLLWRVAYDDGLAILFLPVLRTARDHVVVATINQQLNNRSTR